MASIKKIHPLSRKSMQDNLHIKLLRQHSGTNTRHHTSHLQFRRTSSARKGRKKIESVGCMRIISIYSDNEHLELIMHDDESADVEA